ncbi:MAG: hypothetical protein V1927_06850 [Candidatus Omnitrophota bacterium]
MNRIKDEVNKLLQSVSKESDNGVEGIDKELSELRTQKNKWLNAIEKGLDESIAIERLNEIKVKEDRLMKEKVERLSRTNASYDIDRYMGQVTNRIKNFDKVMLRGDISEKKAMMRGFLHKIEVDPTTGKCYYYFLKCPITDENTVGNSRIIRSRRTLTTN